MKIILAHQRSLIREGLNLVLLKYDNNMEIIETNSCIETLEIVKQQPELDLILFDSTICGMSGLKTIKQIRQINSNLPIMILCSTQDSVEVGQAFELGAQGYIEKSSSSLELYCAMQLILSGGVYFPPSLQSEYKKSKDNAYLVGNIGNNVGKTGITKADLTQRQIEILNLLKLGKTNKEIGRCLGLSTATVKNHLAAIFKTLNVNNRTKASFIAMKLDFTNN